MLPHHQLYQTWRIFLHWENCTQGSAQREGCFHSSPAWRWQNFWFTSDLPAGSSGSDKNGKDEESVWLKWVHNTQVVRPINNHFVFFWFFLFWQGLLFPEQLPTQPSQMIQSDERGCTWAGGQRVNHLTLCPASVWHPSGIYTPTPDATLWLVSASSHLTSAPEARPSPPQSSNTLDLGRHRGEKCADTKLGSDWVYSQSVLSGTLHYVSSFMLPPSLRPAHSCPIKSHVLAEIPTPAKSPSNANKQGSESNNSL